MKHKRLLLLLFAVFVRPALYGQFTCTNPPNCIQNPGTNSTGSPVIGQPINFATGDLPGWDKLSGTPKYGPGMAMSTGIQLANGDGVKTCYNFRAGVTYHLCFWARNANTTTTGNIILEANNGTGGSYIIWNTSLSSPFNFYPGTTFQNYQRTFTIPAGGGFNELRIYTTGVTGAYAVVFDDIQVTEKPVLIATPTTINACESTELKATSNNNDLDVTWSNTATLTPSSGIGTTVTARPCTTSVYTATYKSQCALSCGNNTAQITVTVNPMNANISASPATITPCSAGATLTATSSSPVTVSWTPTTGLTPASGMGAVVNARPCTTTVYTARYLCTASGCTTARSITINVDQSGNTVSASPTTITGCQTSSLTVSSVNPMTITWSPNYNLSSTIGTPVTAQPCSTFIYNANFFCPANSCTYTKPVTVTVQPSGSIINNSATIPCRDPISMSFSGSPCAGSTYLWKGPNNNTLSTSSSFNMLSSTPADQGTYTLTITSPTGCVSTYTSVVTMTNCCNVNTNFHVTGINPVRFAETTSANGLPVTQGEWYWDFGDGASSNLRAPAHLYVPKDTYNVCLTAVVSDGLSTCCDKICKNVVIADINDCVPKAAFDYRVVNPISGLVQFADMSATAGTACLWTWTVNSVVQSTAQNPAIILPPGAPPYNVCLEVTNCSWAGPLCPDTWCKTIKMP